MLFAPQAAWADCSERKGIGICVDGAGVHVLGAPLAPVGVIIGLACAVYAIRRIRARRQ